MSTSALAEKISKTSEVVVKDDPNYSLGYIPALDGLRAVSILLVIFAHEIGPVSSEYGHKFNGWIGVDVFFVISGFLITSILLKEAAKKGGTTDSGKFSLRNFYLRRWLRICPVYYIYLAVVAGWYMFGGDHHMKPFVYAALYLTNLDIAYGWGLIPMKPFLTHLWSLGLEEQFYLIWPAALKMLKKHAVTAVTLTIAAVYCWRLYLVAHGATWYRIFNGIDTKIDVLMAGVLLALLLSKDSIKKASARFLGNGFVQVALAWLALQAFQWLGPPSAGSTNDQLFFWGVKMPLTTVLIAALLSSVVTGSRGPLARILAGPAPVFVGKLSYSLYLWHPLVHLLYCAFYWDFVSKHAATAELYQYGLIFAAACISYFLIEMPFLKLKTRFN